MNFDFGCARSLYHQNVHPRVLIAPDGLEELKRRARSGAGKKIMTALRQWVRLPVGRGGGLPTPPGCRGMVTAVPLTD